MTRQRTKSPRFASKCHRVLAVLVLTVVTATLAECAGAATVLMVNPRWVDETAVPASLDYGTTAFGSLTAAVAAASQGDHIVLSPGRYEAPAEQFPIVVDKTIEICSAEGNSETILSGPPTKAVLEIKAAGARIEGLTIEFRRYGLVVLADRVHIRRNLLLLAAPEYRQTSCGIWLAGAREAQIMDNEFINCGLAIAGPPVSDRSKGLPVLTGLFEVGEDSDFFTTHSIEHNLVNAKPLSYLVGAEGVDVPEDAGQVILADCHDMVLDGLDVSWTSIGVKVAYCTGIQITDVTASNCGLFGIYLCYANECRIAGVTCNEDTHGLDLRAAKGNVVRDCTATACGQGIFLSWSSGNSLVKCSAQGNGIGILIASGESNQIASSRIIENELGINVEDEQSLLLTENVISGNTTTGMRFRNTDCAIYGNSFLENWVGLIAINSDEIIISNNEFSTNAQCGLHIHDLDRITLTLNRFTDNANNHLEAAGTLTNSLITQNSFTGTQGMILNDMANSLDLSLNWWGTTDPEQIAERCRGAVEYVPFLMTMP